MSQQTNPEYATWDARKYPHCPPHDGTKGLKWNRFTMNFLTSIATVDLKDPAELFDLAERIQGIDEGGDVAPPGANNPIPLPAGAPAQRRFTRRNKLAYV